MGSEMRRLGAVSPNNYIFTDVAELDITNGVAVALFVKQHSIIDFFASAGIIAVLYPLIYLVDWKKFRKQSSVETA